MPCDQETGRLPSLIAPMKTKDLPDDERVSRTHRALRGYPDLIEHAKRHCFFRSTHHVRDSSDHRKFNGIELSRPLFMEKHFFSFVVFVRAALIAHELIGVLVIAFARGKNLRGFGRDTRMWRVAG